MVAIVVWSEMDLGWESEVNDDRIWRDEAGSLA